LNDFIKGKYDILLGSKPISTGVDGLQKVSDRLIILSLPWTNAELVQLVGRINRQGSLFIEYGIDVIIPLVSIKDESKTYKWDYDKYNRITYKKTIANAAVDGIIPDSLMPSREKFLEEADEKLNEWIDRLRDGNIMTVERNELSVDFSFEISEEEKLNRINSELSEFNRRAKTTTSHTLNKELNENPSAWHRYHLLRRESMKNWNEIPYVFIAKNITCHTDLVIDFGCGDNKLKDEIPYNQVTSVDHIAIDDSVIACDMSDLSAYVTDESHDVAVFSLSLWGTNYKDYLREAYRALKRKGFVYIAEPTTHFESDEQQSDFKNLLKDVGFKMVGDFDIRDKFSYVTAIKI
jgi:superfamily II DNA/RNA helicase